MVTRRALLLGSALGTTVLLAAQRARALSTEEISIHSGLGLALSNRCGGSGEHAELVAGLEAQLAARRARPGETATATCPLCGCPVTATEP